MYLFWTADSHSMLEKHCIFFLAADSSNTSFEQHIHLINFLSVLGAGFQNFPASYLCQVFSTNANKRRCR